MSTNNLSIRAPGSFSPAVGPTSSSRSFLSKEESSSSAEDLTSFKPQQPRLNTNIPRNTNSPVSAQVQTPRPLYSLAQANNSTSSLHSLNFSRPTTHSSANRAESPRVSNQATSKKSSNSDHHRHGRKHSSTQGSFEAYLPTAASNNLNSIVSPNGGMSASHIAAKSAMEHQTHVRQRSQTIPSPQTENSSNRYKRGPSNPPMFSFTEPSGPQENNHGNQIYPSGFVGGVNGNVAHTAANMVFPKSPMSSPGLAPPEYTGERDKDKEKPIKSEKSKVKLFSRPGKIGISKDKEAKAGPLASPNMMNFTSLQRGNYSSLSVLDTQSATNSSSATIRPAEAEEKKLEKEKHKHHFLSRQKHKLTSKDDHNLPLSSAASNSKPVDPNAPSSLYNFNLPLSPSASTTSFSKSMSGLDLRHGGRALREKKKEKEDKSEGSIREGEISYPTSSSEKTGASSLGSCGATSFLAASSINYASSICGYDAPADIAKYGLERLGPEDVWPFLKTKLLAVFEGEDLRLPVEDLNRIVSLHLQAFQRKRSPRKSLTDEFNDLLYSGFSLLDQSLRFTPDEHLIPQLVETWIFAFTVILPFMQAVFLPFDLELTNYFPVEEEEVSTAQDDFSVRSMVLRSFRDVVILPRFDTLKSLFPRLNIESASPSFPEYSMLSPFLDNSTTRPGTAMSLDPGIASYGSQNTILFDPISPFGRSRAFSNVSSNPSYSDSLGIGGFSNSRLRDIEPTLEISGRHGTEVIGRLLQCVGVLNSVHNGSDDTSDGDTVKQKMAELIRCLKLHLSDKERVDGEKRAKVGARVRVHVMSFGAAIEV